MDNKQNLESASDLARKGFDTAGKPVQKLGVIPTIVLAVLIMAIAYFFIESMFAPTRNCIGSINGAPECSDCSAQVMKTVINGKSYGKCTANPGTGNYSDQCTLNCANQ